MQRLSEVLKDIKAKAAAEAVLLTSADGLVLDAVQDDGIDLESLAAYAASNIMTSERMGESAHCGAPESVIIIYEDKALVMAALGPMVAVLLGSTVGQLGNLRLQLRRAMPDLTAALAEEFDLTPARPRAAAKGTPASVVQPEVAAPAPAPAPAVEPAQPADSADPELNGNDTRSFAVTLQGSAINLR